MVWCVTLIVNTRLEVTTDCQCGVIRSRGTVLTISPDMKEWILVTGGAGYVGSHCVLQILQAGHHVVIIDNLSNSSQGQFARLFFVLFDLIGSGVISKLEALSGRAIPLHNVDLTVKEDIRAVFGQYTTSHSRISSVIHFAALKSVGESCKAPLRYYQTNVTGSLYLMEVMMEFNVKKIVYSSSATVYGQPQYLPIDENHPTGNCTNPYGKSKLFMEEIFKVSFFLEARQNESNWKTNRKKA